MFDEPIVYVGCWAFFATSNWLFAEARCRKVMEQRDEARELATTLTLRHMKPLECKHVGRKEPTP